jgi:hypothetical protein
MLASLAKQLDKDPGKALIDESFSEPENHYQPTGHGE